jgi:tight adherence protein B
MMRKALALALAALIGCVALLTGLAPAGAQDGNQALAVREVDATDPTAVRITFTYAGDRNDLTDLAVREAGNLVDTSTAVPLGDQQSLGIVLAIDASGSMQEGALIERVLEAARAFIDGKAASDQIAIVTFNREVRLLQDFTTDKTVLNDALDKISLEAETAVYDGIVRAASLFSDSELQPNIVVFSDGEDSVSRSSAAKAEASVVNVGGALFALGIENDGFKTLEGMAAATGGTSAIAGDPAGVGELFDSVQATLRKQYVVTYASQQVTGTVPLTLSVGNQQAVAEFVSGSNQSGAASLVPEVVQKPSGPSFLRSSAGLLIGLVLVMVAVTAIALSLGTTFLTRDTSLNQALQPYGEGFVARTDSEFDEDDGGDGRGQSYAQTPMLQRAVEATGQFAERQGLLTKVEGLLERANLPLRPAEAIFFYVAGVAVVLLLFLAATKSPFVSLVGTVVLAIIPPSTLSFLARRRQKQFDSLLPDTLHLLASTLRAGYSLMQGVEAVSQEVSEPVGRELRRVVTEARLGRPLEESLEQVAERMDSPDFAWAVMAVRIQREVGGNLAELLVTVADTMTERERLRRDVNALTAEGRVSAIVLGLLPLGIGVFIMGSNPGYLDPLFDETLGKAMLIGAGVMMGVGFYWMKKTIEIEI